MKQDHPGTRPLSIGSNWSVTTSRFTVYVNGVAVTSQPINAVARLVINSLAGNDTIYVHGSITTPIEAHGGIGNDRITGGAGNDVLFGDDFGQSGMDVIVGGSGNDVLIGGANSDQLAGSAGHDILIGGEFMAAFDTSFANLRSISDAWATSGIMTPGVASNIVDIAIDQLTGGTGRDWLLRNSVDRFLDIKREVGDMDQETII